MEIEVKMLAFMEGEIRTVTIPDDEWQSACEVDAVNRSGSPDAALRAERYPADTGTRLRISWGRCPSRWEVFQGGLVWFLRNERGRYGRISRYPAA